MAPVEEYEGLRESEEVGQSGPPAARLRGEAAPLHHRSLERGDEDEEV